MQILYRQMIQTDVLDYHQLGQPIRQESSQVQVAETSDDFSQLDPEKWEAMTKNW